MVGTILGLFVTATIILIKDYETESTWWLAGFLFLCGLGAFSSVTASIFNNIIDPKYMDLVYYISARLSVSAHYLAPVCILIYAMLYSNLINNKIVYLLLFIPEILCYILLPIKNNDLKTTTELLQYIGILCIVEVPYLFSAIVLLIYSFVKEKYYLIKKYKFVNIVIIVSGLIYVTPFNFILRALGMENSWELFSILIPIHFVIFIYFANKFAVFGDTMKFDKYKFAFENIIDYICRLSSTFDPLLQLKLTH
ncbi:hypothetical protein [Clostridium puniceum]|nr:hypothetical protein [Clostridium puniceum]